MRKLKQIRELIFQWHRYLGLFLGILIAIAGLTASVMIVLADTWEIRTIGTIEPIVPQAEQLSLSAIASLAEAAYGNQGEFQVHEISPTMFPERAERSPVLVTLIDEQEDDSKELSIMVNPYTGQMLGEAPGTPFYDAMYKLHYNLFAGDIGEAMMGIVGLFGSILVFTGIALWPGWRKLSTGFKIKWNAHPKRRNFDLHKVAGIFASLFLTMTLFTGFIYNTWDLTVPVIYWMTFSQEPDYPSSNPISGQSPLSIDDLVQKAETAMPGGTIKSIHIPTEPEETFDVYKRFPGDISWSRDVMLDRYSGEVLAYHNPPANLANVPRDPLGTEIMKAFAPMHFGRWAGWFSRFLYVCVGLAPTLLLITGFLLWRYRRRNTNKTPIKFAKNR
jgi:uncharacterized iron-regulated membrane protein